MLHNFALAAHCVFEFANAILQQMICLLLPASLLGSSCFCSSSVFPSICGYFCQTPESFNPTPNLIPLLEALHLARILVLGCSYMSKQSVVELSVSFWVKNDAQAAATVAYTTAGKCSFQGSQLCCRKQLHYKVIWIAGADGIGRQCHLAC